MTSVTRELRELSTPDLYRRLEEAQQDLINTRFSLATHQAMNTAHVTAAKRQIARINTIITERELEEA